MKKQSKCKFMGTLELIEPKKGNVFKVKFLHGKKVWTGTIKLPFETDSDYPFFARVFLETKWK